MRERTNKGQGGGQANCKTLLIYIVWIYFKNFVKNRKNLIQQHLNKIRLLKLKKHWENLENFIAKIQKKYWKFIAKIWKNSQNFDQNFLQILFLNL